MGQKLEFILINDETPPKVDLLPVLMRDGSFEFLLNFNPKKEGSINYFLDNCEGWIKVVKSNGNKDTES